jgi:hypothetical protein
MHDWSIKNPLIFFPLAGALVAYILYMMIRRRKGLRAGDGRSEAEL